jgi:hypothetical protein
MWVAYMYSTRIFGWPRKVADWDEGQLAAEDRKENGRLGDQRWNFVCTY